MPRPSRTPANLRTRTAHSRYVVSTSPRGVAVTIVLCPYNCSTRWKIHGTVSCRFCMSPYMVLLVSRASVRPVAIGCDAQVGGQCRARVEFVGRTLRAGAPLFDDVATVGMS